MSKRVHFVMPDDLIARIDAAVPEGVSRGEFVRRAIERALGALNQNSVIWVGYEVAPPESITKTHPTDVKAFATEQAARDWANEVELRDNLPYGFGRHIVPCELRR